MSELNNNYKYEHSYGNLISLFFQRLNQAGFKWCVLRNYDGLPDDVGNDLDLLIQENEVLKAEQILITVASELHWKVVSRTRRLGHIGLDLCYGKIEICSCLRVDLFTRFVWRGSDYCFPDEVFKKCSPEKDFFVPNRSAEVATILLKELLNMGRIREKYWKRIRMFSVLEQDVFKKVISYNMPRSLVDTIYELACVGDWNGLTAKTRRLRRALVFHSVYRSPIKQFLNWGEFIWLRFKEFIHDAPGAFIVLIGPDGSGKTTVSKELVATLGQCFKSASYFHHRPSYLPSIRSLFKFRRHGKSENMHSDVVGGDILEDPPSHGMLRTVIYAMYYFFDYFLAHFKIIRIKAKGGLIIADRYFYDYYILSIYKNTPRLLLRFIEFLIPKPTMVVFLSCPVNVLLKRKRELTPKEASAQLSRCRELVNRLDQGVEINTTDGISTVIERILFKFDVLKKING